MLVPMKNLHGESVLVNPANVRWCKDQGRSVLIYFEKDHQIEVHGPLSQVQKDLDRSRN